MRLFLRHIFRSIKKSPLQPLLICLTVMLAVAVAVTALRASEMLAVHSAEVAQADRELGDILISMRGDSETRLLFDEDAKALLGEDGTVLGTFSLTAFPEREGKSELLDVSATDLVAADRFYRFEFLEYGCFTTENLNSAAVISASAAEALGLSLGDTLTFKVLDVRVSYTVEAIAADTGLLSQSDMLVSMSGIIDILADRVPLVASLGPSFAPCNRLMIKVGEGVDIATVVDRLITSPLFADKTVESTANSSQADFFTLIQAIFFWVIALLLLVLAGFLIACSLKLLHNRRSREYALFCNAGASPGRIRCLVILESLCYALVGGGLGLLLATPMLNAVAGLYSWQKAPLTVGVLGVFVGFFFSVALMLICTVVHLRHHKLFGTAEEQAAVSVSRKPLTLKNWLPPLLLGLLGIVVLLFLPVKIRYFGSVFLLVPILWITVVLTPPLIGLLARSVEKIGGRPSFLLAVKSMRNRFALRHVGRLLAVVLSLVLTLLVCVQAFVELTDSMTTEFSSDLVAANVSQETKIALADDPGVMGTMEMSYFTGVQLNGATGITAVSVSGDTTLCGDVDSQPKRIPTGYEVVISKGLSALTGARVGDAVSVTIRGVSYELIVTEILSISANFIYFDQEALGLPDNLFCIRLLEDASGETVVRLTAALETDGATLVPLDQIFDVLPATLSGHLRLLRWSVIAAVLISLVACINVLAQQYRERTTEREVLRVCGMERVTMVRMHLLEGLFLLLVALAVAALVATVLCILIDVGLRSFGMVLFA